MMIRLLSLYFACFLGFFVPASQATEFENHADITRAAEELLLSHYSDQYADSNSDIDISVNKPDNRLRLKKCDKPLTAKLHGQSGNSGRATVRILCEGRHSWGLFITARTTVTTEVAVAARSLKRGELIQAGDIQMSLRKLTGLGPGTVAHGDRLIGKELRRSIRAGDPVRLSAVTEPTVIKRGDDVAIEAKLGNVAVVSSGTALSDGRIGQQIRIRNSKSERIVKARVTGPGRTQVRL